MLKFSPSLWFVFPFSIVSSTKVSHFDGVPFISPFVTCTFGILSKTLSTNTRSWSYFCVSSKSSTVLALTFRSIYGCLESPLDCKELQPVHSEGDQSWVFFARTDAEAETPKLGHLMQRVDSLEKTLMLRGIGGRKRRGRQRMR